MKKIILIGPESTGKSTLTKDLANHFKCNYIEEYSRHYLNQKKSYKKEDLLKIAKKQLDLEENKNNKTPYLFIDTDLIVIKVWSIYKYGNCDDWILKQIENQKKENRFYLLCKPDIPWEKDSQRKNPHDRMKLFNYFKFELKQLKHEYTIIEGENRLKKSIQKIIKNI